MDAARCKEIVFKTIEYEAGSNQWAEYHHCAHLRGKIEAALAKASAAAQEGYNNLPRCAPDTPVAGGCAYDWKKCKYRMGGVLDGIGRCALVYDEPAADTEPDTKRERHWQKRAEYFAGRLDSHDSLTEDEANSIRFMQIRDRIADVDAMLSERVDKLEKDAVEDAHALIDLHCRIEKVDTAFSDTLKGYLGRLDVVAGWKELHTAYHRLKEDEDGSQTLSKQ